MRGGRSANEVVENSRTIITIAHSKLARLLAVVRSSEATLR